MNRRGFFSLVGKLVAVGAALKIDPGILGSAGRLIGIADPPKEAVTKADVDRFEMERVRDA